MHDDELILVKLRIHKSQYPELHHSIANVDKRKRATIVKRLAETGADATRRDLDIPSSKGDGLSKMGQEFIKPKNIKNEEMNIDDYQFRFDPESLTKPS